MRYVPKERITLHPEGLWLLARLLLRELEAFPKIRAVGGLTLGADPIAAAVCALSHESGRDLVVCGDLNIAHADIDVHPRERKPGVIGQRPEERELFDRLLGEHIVDVGRALHPDDKAMFSWWPPWRNMRQRNIGWRIDYILASRPIADRATDCVVLADVGTSDHAPVVMTINN